MKEPVMGVVTWIFPGLASGLSASHLIFTGRERCPDGQSDLRTPPWCSPPPLMTIIAELGTFPHPRQAAARLPALADGPSPPMQAAAANGAAELS